MLHSQDFCQKRVRVIFHNFHTVYSLKSPKSFSRKKVIENIFEKVREITHLIVNYLHALCAVFTKFSCQKKSCMMHTISKVLFLTNIFSFSRYFVPYFHWISIICCDALLDIWHRFIIIFRQLDCVQSYWP